MGPILIPTTSRGGSCQTKRRHVRQRYAGGVHWHIAPAVWSGADAIAEHFLARDVIYTSRAYATMSVSVCLSVCL